MNIIWEKISKFDRKKTIHDTLKSNVIFKDLSILELKLVENIINVRHFKRDEVIFKSGDAGLGMYIIVDGSIEILSDEKSESTSLQEGDFFGELALTLESSVRQATAVAKDDCIVVGFFKPDLVQVINRNPNAGAKILMRVSQVLGQRLVEAQHQIKLARKKVESN